ncbi:D-2-hydroxyacid dehydrogenase family protein [Pseudorhodoplanes sp.]|jgi:phosphoglycerate dehydrogenase-like enzyme|uniref:D-2-hydroxyacid dehydrogenase family protein n=1 Tax=Pseudorhodoplanes sp. TaxID=1934341 RepID=UPI002C7B3523|nr:D-2-hydroxyacid dehydrogenase family protein [Pseudorhodoplanes sp.]HWV43972.1 D-2-hydroxyacid dehydrogenase family protein [Pseudorhodoplanes sp.]
MRYRCAVLDDYQNVALKMADWSKVTGDVDLTVFNERLGDEAAVAAALRDFDIVCIMRERTPLPRSLIEKLPNLKLLVTSGMKNAAIDVAAAKQQGVVVCGTDGAKHPTAELAVGLMIDLARNITVENARMRAGEAWQNTIGMDLNGRTLGLIGLGNLGQRVAKVGLAFGMNVIAWSPNLTPERCREHGVAYATKADLFQQSDYISIHLVLSDRTRGLVGATDLKMMKPSAFLINTSRGPIVDEAALINALQDKTIAGAGLDVFDVEPLPRDHVFRKLPNALITPHLGYVTQEGYRYFYGGTVEAIRAWLDGKPIRVLG